MAQTMQNKKIKLENNNLNINISIHLFRLDQ